MSYFQKLKVKIQNRELSEYLIWRIKKAIYTVTKPISPLFLPFIYIFKFPKYINILFRINFLQNFKNVSELSSHIKLTNYETYEGYIRDVQRIEIINLIKDSDLVLEIGFNFGHTSEDIILKNHRQLVCIDNFRHVYSKISKKYFEKKYPQRIRFLNSNSDLALKKLINEGKMFDLIIIDGGHTYEVCFDDIKYSLELLKDNGIMIIDNLEIDSVNEAVESFKINKKIIEINQLNFKEEFNLSNLGVYKQPSELE